MKPTHIRKTNQQLLKEIMSFSRFGPLAEVFVMDALTKAAELIAASKPEDYPANVLVHPDSWIGVAREIKLRLDAYYGKLEPAPAPAAQEAA